VRVRACEVAVAPDEHIDIRWASEHRYLSSDRASSWLTRTCHRWPYALSDRKADRGRAIRRILADHILRCRPGKDELEGVDVDDKDELVGAAVTSLSSGTEGQVLEVESREQLVQAYERQVRIGGSGLDEAVGETGAAKDDRLSVRGDPHFVSSERRDLVLLER
jgi:hypothetical protein